MVKMYPAVYCKQIFYFAAGSFHFFRSVNFTAVSGTSDGPVFRCCVKTLVSKGIIKGTYILSAILERGLLPNNVKTLQNSPFKEKNT
jgi:hypothetical protein